MREYALPTRGGRSFYSRAVQNNTRVIKLMQNLITKNKSGYSIITLTRVPIISIIEGQLGRIVCLLEGLPNLRFVVTQRFIEQHKVQVGMGVTHRGRIDQSRNGKINAYCNRKTKFNSSASTPQGEYTLDRVNAS